MVCTNLVTGGGGFIGSHLVDSLLSAGHKVRVLDNFASGRRQNLKQHVRNKRLTIIEGDVAEEQAVWDAMRGVDRVFHLAALADIVPSITEPERYFKANVTGTFNVVKQSYENNVKRFLYAASSSCYGIPDEYPTPETAPINPQYPYALTKFLGEQVVMHWAQVYALPAISLRLFNVYGSRARTSGAYGAMFGVFLGQLLNNLPLTIVGDGNQTRDFTYVTDVANAFTTAANSAIIGRIFNVGTSNDVSVNRIADLIGAKKTVQIPKRPGEPDCTKADITRIRTELGWEPTVGIEEGVNRMLETIEDWRTAPAWTVERINDATKEWFQHLSERRTAGGS